ncbi:MAG TPA: hypothetical protein VHP83_07500 [Aggregatilineaceae bacterium]|nr:hypothetical protein [Aggregatilineaceae bacterium]
MSIRRSRGPLAILELVFELGVGIVALLTLVTDSDVFSDVWAYIGRPYLLAFVMMAVVVWAGFDSGKWRVWTPEESKAAGWGFRDGF